MNFSEWGSGPSGREAAEEYGEGSMPPFQYLVMHPEANFSDADRAAFIQGLIATFGADD